MPKRPLVLDLAPLKQELVRLGPEVGLDAVGFCHAEPFLDMRARLEVSSANGWSAGMAFTYRNPQRSTDPAASMAEVASLVVGARSYLRASPPRPEGYVGQVARYSWSDQYRPLRSALGRLADRLRQEGYKAMVLADDNALVDRAAALRAGLGWAGRNTNVLLFGSGSYFLLGSVLTDAPLAQAPHQDGQGFPQEEEPSPSPGRSGCGSCRRCLEACPTGALLGEGVLDARRCLAWLLQAPGPFPPEMREALGGRIYGCDDCQEACPPNRLQLRRKPPPAPEAGAEAWVDLLWVLEASDQDLEARLGRWYVARRQWRHVRRNALVALGNVGDGSDPALQRVLVEALKDPDPLVRGHAVWTAWRLGRTDLLAGLGDEQDPFVRCELGRAGLDMGGAPEVSEPARGGAGGRL